jgi:hypothetical protein
MQYLCTAEARENIVEKQYGKRWAENEMEKTLHNEMQ